MRNSVIKRQVEEFRDAINQGINGFVRCGEIYVQTIDNDPDASETFRLEFADIIPSEMWSNFEAIGRKWMHPRLLMGGMTNRRKAAKIKQLPYSLQEKIFNHNRFELLLEGGDKLKLDIMEATTDQVEQLFSDNNIRTLPEQRAWIEDRKASVSDETVEVLPYVIRNGCVIFRKNVKLTRSEMKRLLAEM